MDVAVDVEFPCGRRDRDLYGRRTGKNVCQFLRSRQKRAKRDLESQSQIFKYTAQVEAVK